ncbi:mitochondrial import receptor subunit TOM20-like [Iris pallida]|uniref:Mitochondrial import receptor subunit TOM20-like n=1 Tax=Iris pallida TaxID=29817 RepID=A0AAX6H9S6_IRIPA|nr:mitochondrial import receptor subunit TOM20-like [Iris pallida]KAJ6846306.1 mitochondrial import receptor subunit TOM20-like [Iris pallida]
MAAAPPSDDIDRLLFLELARKNFENIYTKNPVDTDNLKNWAEALLELASFQDRAESIKYIRDAESKLAEALEISPRKHDILYYLGNAYTSHAFHIQDQVEAKLYFTKATQYFQEALKEEPTNTLYQQSVELSLNAPALHTEFQKHMADQAHAVGGRSTSRAKVPKKKKNSDLKYDILGWVILAVGIVAWVGMAKSHVPPP